MACSPKIKTNITSARNVSDRDVDVIVLGLEEESPSEAVELGNIKIGDTGFTTNCDWEETLQKIKEEARKVGGNVVKITEHKIPGFASSCHRIEAKILALKDTRDLVDIGGSGQENTDNNQHYAKLYVYRMGPNMGVGPFNVFLGDSAICWATNNFTKEIKLTRKGLDTLWARTGAKGRVPIDIEYGKTYYLRCGAKIGVLRNKETIALVDPVIGKVEYEAVQRKNKKRSKN
ncbi:hypothetical protein [Sinomicrobium sp. M5D2P17]